MDADLIGAAESARSQHVVSAASPRDPVAERRADRLAVGLGALGGAALVAALAIPRLGRDPLWLDEAYSLGVTNQFAYGVSESGGTMVAYYALLWLWSQISDAPAWLRALSMVFAMATMWPLAALGRRLAGRGVALLAPLLLAGGYMFQSATLEARTYTLEIFTVTLCWYLLVRAVEAGTDTEAAKPWWVALTLIAPWGVFMHGLFVIFLAAMVLAALLSPKPRAALARMVPLLGATAVLMLGLLWLGVARVGDWVKPTKFVYVKFTMYQYLGGYLWVRLVTLAALIGLVVALVRGYRRVGFRLTEPSENADGDGVSGDGGAPAPDEPADVGEPEARDAALLHNWRLLVPVLWFLVPPVALLVISLVRPEFVDRYFVAIAPAVALIVAWGLVRAVEWLTSRTSLPAWAGVGALVVAGGVVTAGWSVAGQENLNNRTVAHWDDIAELVAAKARPGDGLLLYGDLSRPPFEAAWSRIDHDVVPTLVNAYRPLGEVKRYDRTVPGDEAAYERVLRHDRVFAINVGQGELPAAFYELHGPLPEQYEIAEVWEFADRRAPIIIRLYVKADDASS